MAPQALDLEVTGGASPAEIPPAGGAYQEVPFDGLIPRIINMTPVPALPLLPGISDEQPKMQSARLK